MKKKYENSKNRNLRLDVKDIFLQPYLGILWKMNIYDLWIEKWKQMKMSANA